MRVPVLSALVGCLVSTPFVFGLSLSLQRRASGGPIGLVNRWFRAHTVTITVQDQDVVVTVDTGSSDLWIKPDHMPPFQNTNINMELRYLDANGVKGPIGIAPISLRDSDGRFKVDKQAFIAANTSTMSHMSGVQGILGLGPERNSLVLPQVLRKSDKSAGAQKVDGRPFLQKVLEQQSESLRFFALEFLRSELGVAHAPGGSLWIAEHNPSYLSLLTNAPQIPLYPDASIDHYMFLLEGLSVGGSPIQLQSFGYPMAPLNHAVAVLDSGTPLMFLQASISTEYHSKIPGAVKGPRNLWIVPCRIPVVTVQFGGQLFPFHPHDLIGQRQAILPDGRTVRVCYSAFYDQQYFQGVQAPDMLLGSPFLQNVYSVYSFQTNNKPFVQLVSTTTPDIAASQAGLLWPDHIELPPAELVGLVDLESLYNVLFTKEEKVMPKQ